MERRQRRPCHAGTLPAGTVAPGSVPAPAPRHRNGEQTPPPTICTGTHPAQQIAPPVQTEGQSSSAQRAAALAFFFCAAFPPARPAGSAARHALGVVGGRPGEKLESTRGALDAVPGYCANHLHREGPAPPRRADDPAAHKLHGLHILPDLTAASSPPPAPTDTAPRQPCRPPAAADHPANSQKPPTAARRRRGQILYLTGIWPLQYSQ